MHLKVIACEVLAREIYACAACAKHTTDISLFTQGLHDNSDECRMQLQSEIDAVPADKFDALLLGYGLCNNSVAGIRAGRVKMIVPRGHDCISFFLGSKERYAREFAAHPGTYYYTSGWIEYGSRGGERVAYMQKSGLAKRAAYEEFVAKYGEENGRFLFESMTQWETHYDRGALIQFPFAAGLGLEGHVRAICKEKEWDYAEIPGDLSLIQAWLNGEWDNDRFLTVEPGRQIEARYDDQIIACRACK